MQALARAGAGEGRRGDPPLDGAPARPHRRREGRRAAGAGHVAADVAPQRARPPRFAPAGQSTQMIVGADATDDRAILATSADALRRLPPARASTTRRSARSRDAARALPLHAPPLVREHRLYQADWLMRFYGFAHDEIVAARRAACSSLDVDPKLAWALAHRERFPVDLNRAPREMLLRVPGLGVQGGRPAAAGAPRAPRCAAPTSTRLRVPLAQGAALRRAGRSPARRALEARRPAPRLATGAAPPAGIAVRRRPTRRSTPRAKLAAMAADPALPR